MNAGPDPESTFWLQRRRTVACVLLTAVALIVHGSLYPWHFVSAASNPWLVLAHSWPRAWTESWSIDAFNNVMIYVPLGALVFLAFIPGHSLRFAIAGSTFAGLLLSLSMELLQTFVPGRSTSLLHLVCNTSGAAAGALSAWRFRSVISRFRPRSLPPALMLISWACFHELPLVPSIHFSRMRNELMMWLHPASFSLIEFWSFTAEWLAAGVAVRWFFGRRGLQWLPLALILHFVLRPFIPARPLLLEEVAGILAAVSLWNILPASVRSSPLLLVSVVILQIGVSMQAYGMPEFSWVPFGSYVGADRVGAMNLLFRRVFDYGAILWLWWVRGMSYWKSGAILTGLLIVLVAIERYAGGGALTPTDAVEALLLSIGYSVLAIGKAASEKATVEGTQRESAQA